VRRDTIWRLEPPGEADRSDQSQASGKNAAAFFINFGNEKGRGVMTKLEAIIQPSRLDSVKEALQEVGVNGMTVSEVRGHGRQKGHTEVYRGSEYTVDLLPKIKLEMVLPDGRVDAAVQSILKAAKTGKIGDGKIFLTKVDEAIRIRNEERGEAAL
jgi:nitrogen regulatory protein P-II 1